MNRLNEILEDLMIEIGFEVTTIENLIGHAEAQMVIDMAQDQDVTDQLANIAYLKGKMEMAQECELMVKERMIP